MGTANHMGTPDRERTFTRRQFHVYNALMHHEGLPLTDAIQAVAEYEEQHPDIDMDEELSWEQWHEIDASLDSA
jgi:hypothetical protein